MSAPSKTLSSPQSWLMELSMELGALPQKRLREEAHQQYIDASISMNAQTWQKHAHTDMSVPHAGKRAVEKKNAQ
jgi:hypothetical protein